MHEGRIIKTIRLKHDTHCRKCSATILAGKYACWSQGGVVWHWNGCEGDDAMLTAALNVPPPAGDFDAWVDRKIEEDHQRFMAAKALRQAATGGVDGHSGTSGEKTEKATTTSTPAREAATSHPSPVTSNPKYAESL